MRSPLFVLLAAFVVSMLIAQQLGGLHRGRTADAVDIMQDFLLRRPALGPAIAAADRNEQALLLAWLNSAGSEERLKLLGVLQAVAALDDGLPVDERYQMRDATLYRHRQRFVAFVNIPTGKPEADAMLDNQVAYISVAGTRQPTSEDLALALLLLPRLEKQLAHEGSHALYDTVGCVHFVHHDFAKAKAAFSEAVKLGERAATSGSTAERAETQRALLLYRKRLEAATTADLQAIEQRTPPLPAILLPLAAEVAGSEAPLAASTSAAPAPAPAPAPATATPAAVTPPTAAPVVDQP